MKFTACCDTQSGSQNAVRVSSAPRPPSPGWDSVMKPEQAAQLLIGGAHGHSGKGLCHKSQPASRFISQKNKMDAIPCGPPHVD